MLRQLLVRFDVSVRDVRVGAGILLVLVLVLERLLLKRLLSTIAMLFVDVDLFAGSRTAETVFLVDSDLFLVLNVAAVGGLLLDGGREGFVMLFVTFPSFR